MRPESEQKGPGNCQAKGWKRPISRLAYRRDEAAASLGVSPTKFDEWVKDGRMPKPIRVDNCVLWDANELSAAWYSLANGGTAVEKNEWDD